MTRLKFNYTTLQSEVIPSLKFTMNSLNTTISSANSLNIPSDFAYASELKKLPSYLKEKRNDLNEVNEWIGKCNRKYQSVQNEINSELNSLANADLRIRARRVN